MPMRMAGPLPIRARVTLRKDKDRETTKHTKDTKESPVRRVGRASSEAHQISGVGGPRSRLDPPYLLPFVFFVCFVVSLFLYHAHGRLAVRREGGASRKESFTS